MRTSRISLLLCGALLRPVHSASIFTNSSIAPASGPRQFDLNLTWQKAAPNGVSRNVILINGQFPGPLLEINQDEHVWVVVHNCMPYNTTMHYHGIEMEGTPWSDGVPGVTQREIRPGESFTSKWTATQYGEYWYHAHVLSQIDDGQYGPIVIHPRVNTPTPFDLISSDADTVRAINHAVANIKPLVLSDWRNIETNTIWQIQQNANMEIPCYDSLLINGQGRVDCWSAAKIQNLTTPQQAALLKAAGAGRLTAKACLPKEVDAKIIAAPFPNNISAIPTAIFDICNSTIGSQETFHIAETKSSNGTWAAFNVVGAYSLATTAFSIDQLDMWIYAVDGEYIRPQKVQAVHVANGDRYAFLVHLTKSGTYTIRQASLLPVQLISGQGSLVYGSATANETSLPWVNDAGVSTSPNVTFFNATTQEAFTRQAIAQKADQTFILTISNVDNASYIWAMNGTELSTTTENNTPTLFDLPRPQYIHDNLTIETLNDTWIDMIFQIRQFPEPSHPIHKHGNKMWQIGSGQGVFNWSSVDEAIKVIPQNFNLVDPPHRDGFGTVDAPTGPTWMAVRYHVTNPGAWFLHCHIQTHMRGGMAMVIKDGVDHWPVVPQEYRDF